MANYFRITAYYPEKDFSVILDSNGRFEKLWQFSAYLVNKGFKILEVGKDENIIDTGYKRVEKVSNKIYLMGFGQGRPEIQPVNYQNRPCKAVSVPNMAYGLFVG